MSFTRKRLGADILLGAGTFNNGSNSVKLRGFRMQAFLEHAGGYFDGTLDLTIYGLSKSIMNRLSTLGMQINLVPNNPITLLAGEGDDDSNLVTAFQGYIIAAYADYNAAPEVAFHINAHTFGAFAAAPADPTSFKGSVDVATIMSGFASKMGMRFENSGVLNQLSNPYFSGSLRTQAQTCVRAAGINWNAGEGGILAIWPRTGSRGGQTRIIAPPPDGGMIGYPMYTAYGIMLQNLYDPTLGLGQKVQVQSSVMPTAQYTIQGLQHWLDSELHQGKWMSEIMAWSPTLPVRPN